MLELASSTEVALIQTKFRRSQERINGHGSVGQGAPEPRTCLNPPPPNPSRTDNRMGNWSMYRGVAPNRITPELRGRTGPIARFPLISACSLKLSRVFTYWSILKGTALYKSISNNSINKILSKQRVVTKCFSVTTGPETTNESGTMANAFAVVAAAIVITKASVCSRHYNYHALNKITHR